MSMPGFTRRAFVATVAAAVVGSAHAQSTPMRFSRVSVDAHGLSARGQGAFRAVVERAAAEELGALFADRMGGSARLVLRIDAITFSADVPGRVAQRGPQGASHDYVEGAALVLGPHGGIIASYPILTALNPGGPWYVEATEGWRLADIGRRMAQWTRRLVAG